MENNVKTQKRDEFIEWINGDVKPEVKKRLPATENIDTFMGYVLNTIRNSPKSINDRTGLKAAILHSASLNLPPGQPFDLCHFITYSSQDKWYTKFFIGYKGYVDIVTRGGLIKGIRPKEVCEFDKFEHDFGTKKFISHNIMLGGDRGRVVGAYAIADYSDGDSTFIVLDRDDLDFAMACSKTSRSQDSPWHTRYKQMCCKTAVIALCNKQLPKHVILSIPELKEALAIEAEDTDLENSSFKTAPESKKPSSVEAVERSLFNG